jgi:hypothetical protein
LRTCGVRNGAGKSPVCIQLTPQEEGFEERPSELH